MLRIHFWLKLSHLCKKLVRVVSNNAFAATRYTWHRAEELRAQNKDLQRKVRELEIKSVLEESKLKHSLEANRRAHEEEIFRLKQSHEEEMARQCARHEDALAEMMKKLFPASSATVNANSIADGAPGSSSSDPPAPEHSPEYLAAQVKKQSKAQQTLSKYTGKVFASLKDGIDHLKDPLLSRGDHDDRIEVCEVLWT